MYNYDDMLRRSFQRAQREYDNQLPPEGDTKEDDDLEDSEDEDCDDGREEEDREIHYKERCEEIDKQPDKE